MSPFHYRALATIWTLLAIFGLGLESAAQETVAVLSAELAPYQEAYAGFEDAFGSPVTRVCLHRETPEVGPETRLVVAFGGRAALTSYPDGVTVVYCLAPGVRLPLRADQGGRIRVAMLPRAGFVVSNLREIQPDLARLGVLWVSETMGDYVSQLGQAASTFGIQTLAGRLGSEAELPDRLRGLLAESASGVWLAPDPALINASTFALVKEFCRSSDIPFYVPTSGLVEKGAVASVSSSFREVGKLAGEVALEVLEGKTGDSVRYPQAVETTLNLAAAAESGLVIPAEVVKRAERVIR
ncbi:MAG: ABC transporter substrate binding protein [Candidatus Latescibacteria bacterium]|jgi:putative ABC transport system substrate-binding protein|nr:ABC transporter substrate binding protein [Candidatus Latescibacterota bacterium]